MIIYDLAKGCEDKGNPWVGCVGAAVTILVEKVKSEQVISAVEVLVSHPAWAISLTLVQCFF